MMCRLPLAPESLIAYRMPHWFRAYRWGGFRNHSCTPTEQSESRQLPKPYEKGLTRNGQILNSISGVYIQ